MIARTGGKFDEFTARATALASREMYLMGRKPTEYSDEYYTPSWVTQPLGEFDLDPCAGPLSAHAKRNVRPPVNGLKVRWKGRIWLNPPYSDVHAWLRKFSDHGDGICLVNGRCETKWFQRLAGGASALLFLAGRVDFLRPTSWTSRPPVGSVLVAYGESNAQALADSGLPGLLVFPENSYTRPHSQSTKYTSSQRVSKTAEAKKRSRMSPV